MEEGGVERVVLSLNRALVAAGHRSVVISRGGRLEASLRADGGDTRAIDLKSKNPLTFFARAHQLRRALRAIKSEAKGEPVVVFAHSRVPAWLFLFANRTLQLPFATYAHGANSVSRYSRVMTRGDAVVVPSKFLADFLLKNYPDAPDCPPAMRLAARLRIISPTVDLTRFDPKNVDLKVVRTLRLAWGALDGVFVTMSIGRITPLKGFDAVIRDFAARRKEHLFSCLVIVGGVDRGKEALLDDLKSLAVHLGVADHVIFAGSQTMIPECLSIANEVVSGNTTKPESFGLSVLEAAAMNKPVRVLRSFGGVAEVLAALEAAGTATPREAVARLYGVEAMTKKTLALLDDLVRKSIA